MNAFVEIEYYIHTHIPHSLVSFTSLYIFIVETNHLNTNNVHNVHNVNNVHVILYHISIYFRFILKQRTA